MKNAYIPGVCNIGPAEIRYRRRAGIVGLIVTLLFFASFFIFPVPTVLRVLIFLPATVTAVGFLQAWLHFCVKFGMSGLFNFGNDLSVHENVTQAEYRRKDQQKAILIIASSALFGILVTLLGIFF